MTLKKKWFDLIASGDKVEEYREIKPYWERRLIGREYDVILFRNGYSPTSPIMLVEYKGVSIKTIKSWETGETKTVYAIKLGEVLKE